MSNFVNRLVAHVRRVGTTLSQVSFFLEYCKLSNTFCSHHLSIRAKRDVLMGSDYKMIIWKSMLSMARKKPLAKKILPQAT
jgi:hypothetical protein